MLGKLYKSLKREVAQVANNLREKLPTIDRNPPPPSSWSQNTAPVIIRHDAPTSSPLHPRTLRIDEVVRETADAVTLVLSDPSGLPVSFAAGQFVTVLVELDGQEYRRAYSASSSALKKSQLSVTCKRVAGGRVSNHINDNFAAGQTLRVLGPSGSFGPQRSTSPRHLVLFAGGSGITPMMSIVRTLLVLEPETRITLIYGNRGVADIIFRGELDRLVCDRLTVRHVLSDPPAQWSGTAGVLDETVSARELDAVTDDSLPREYFVCGPEPMMACVKKTLLARGVPESSIKEEKFSSPSQAASENTAAFSPQPVTVRKNGVEKNFVVAGGQTILEAGLAAGVEMAFSCAMGGCGECEVKLVEGEVELAEPNCLTKDERAKGAILACSSRPKTRVIVEAR
jgi:ferredoxin-NADP reductase